MLGEAVEGASDPFFEYVYLTDDIADGVYAWVTVGIDSTASYSTQAAAYLTPEGGVASSESAGGGLGGSGGAGSGSGNTTGSGDGTMSAGSVSSAASSSAGVSVTSAATSSSGTAVSGAFPVRKLPAAVVAFRTLGDRAAGLRLF